MSEQEINNNPTAEAVANAEQAAQAAPDTIDAGGGEAAPEGSSSDASYEAGGSASSGPSAGGSSSDMGGDMAMEMLTSASKGKTMQQSAGQTLANKKAAASNGLTAKGSAVAGATGTAGGAALTTGSMTLSGLQLAKIVTDKILDSNRVQERGGQVQKAQDWSKGKGKRRTKNRILEGDEPINMRRTKGRGASAKSANEALTGGGKRDPKQSAETARRGRSTPSASLQSPGMKSASFSNSSKQATLARIRHLKEVGGGYQKDGSMMDKEMMRNGASPHITDAAKDKYQQHIRMQPYAPNNMMKGPTPPSSSMGKM